MIAPARRRLATASPRRVSPVQTLAASAKEESFARALHLLRTDERADIRGGIASRSKAKFLGFRNAQGCERFADGFFDEKAFDGQTNLATIRVAPPHGGTGRHVEVSISENDHRVFAAKFENRWNQFFCTRFRDAAAGGHASREQYFVRSGLDQRLTYFPATLHDGDEIFRKPGVEEELLDQRPALRREIARLTDDRVSRSHRRNDLAERNRERVIPRRNNRDDAERLIDQIAALGFRRRAVMRDALGSKRRGGILRPVFCRIQRDKKVGEKRFHSRLAGFKNHSVGQLVARSHDAFAKSSQLRAAVRYRNLHPLALGSARVRNDFRQER